jgi:hypothetical protein
MKTGLKKFLLLVAALSVIVLIAIHVLIYRTPAANAAREALLRDALIADVCGKNIRVSPWYVGWHFISYSGDDKGTARLHFECVGSNASVRVTVEMRKTGDTWRAMQIAIDP